MQPDDEVVGHAVLRDYPLRLWAEQQEHSEELLREFTLLLISDHEPGGGSAPRQLVELARMFADRFGPLLDRLTHERRQAYENGADRIDSVVPLVAGTAELLARVRTVLEGVDDYCRRGELLALARPQRLVDLYDWTERELLAQAGGAAPTPWPGPF